jgi:hypothetical protein
MGFYTTLFHMFFSFEVKTYEPIVGLTNAFPSSNHQWLYLIPVVLISLAWVFNQSIWREIFGFLSSTSNPSNINAKAKITNFASVFLIANYLISANLFFHAFNNGATLNVYFLFTGLIVFIPLIIWFFSTLIMFLTNQRIIFKLHNVHLYYQICYTGMLFFIAAVVRDFYPEYSLIILTIALITAVLLNLFRLIVSAIRGLQLQFSLFYIILYLCTLEILPFIAFYSALNQQIQGLILK